MLMDQRSGQHELSGGAMQDVQHIEYLLKTRFGFQDITVLRDDLHRQDVMPTKRNILAHIDRLVQGAQAGDSLFFHFSGKSLEQNPCLTCRVLATCSKSTLHNELLLLSVCAWNMTSQCCKCECTHNAY